MRTIRADVHTHITLRRQDLPPHVLRAMLKQLAFPNPERENAEREALWNWEQVPDAIRLWQVSGDLIRVPRGFADQLVHGLRNVGISVEWIDRRVRAPIDTSSWQRVDFIEDRDYQEGAITALLRRQQGIIMAPPGAGKTVEVLEAIRREAQRACIITNKAEIARQWVRRAEQWLRYTPGVVGDDSFEVRDITIAMQQTLWTRLDELYEDGFFARFGFALGDEIHHWTAPTYEQVIQRFPALIRGGVSATPDRENGYYPIIRRTIGEIVHTTPRKLLVERGILVQPTVHVIRTPFEYELERSRWVAADEECEGCPKEGRRHRHQNNYQDMLNALIADGARNGLIVSELEKLRGRHILVHSKRIKHLETLRDHVAALTAWPDDRLFMLTGERTTDEREEIVRQVYNGECIVFSTLADEATDIPPLDTLFLTWPQRSARAVEQEVGRIERSFTGKSDAQVFDVMDALVYTLMSQFRDRRRGLYEPNEYPVLDPSKPAGGRGAALPF